MATPETAITDDIDDMRMVREGVKRFSERFKSCDGDAVYALVSLKRLSADLDALTERLCRRFDFSSGRLNVLMALFASPGTSMALSGIGQYCLVTRPNITGLIDGLVRDGLVERTDHPDDRRVVLARLTERGKSFMEWFVPQHFKNVKQLMGCFDRKELQQLSSMLARLRDHMKSIDLPPYESFAG